MIISCPVQRVGSAVNSSHGCSTEKQVINECTYIEEKLSDYAAGCIRNGKEQAWGAVLKRAF
jgi:hypothetical protein